ncbi:vesicle transport through interaction with t-SNAREs homolog 1B-like isoform X2 [Scleropages formosus]|uniref:vesicle transport through interaction with t-SNAREs homolog 1B-like isoform X2 n=1 Tax=Scleropages formosus TaxID=113540 RepID=UPI0008781C3E|nr:vesicle transport through interaction with t-SNAREs homolog 1B-like isoform X2 [Scleropages formosus]
MSSEEFEKMHDIYKSLYDELKVMPERISRCHGERKRLVRDFDEKLGEAEEMLQGMDKELVVAPSSFRNAMSTKLRLYRRDLGKLQRDIKSSDPILGLSGRPGDNTYSIYASQNEQSTQAQSQRALLLQGTESLHRATQSIERSQRVAVETEHIGTDVIEELGEQREQLDRTRDRLVHTGENLSRSRRILRSMSRRIVTNKLLLSVIILMELAVLGAVVYLKFFRH